MYEKVVWKSVLIVFVIGMCIFFAFPPVDGIIPGVKGKLVFGPDLKGGTILALEVEDPSQRDVILQVLRKRRDSLGLKELSIEAVGDRGIQVLAPGELSDDVNAILQQGVLEFKEEALGDVKDEYAKDVTKFHAEGNRGLPKPSPGYEAYELPRPEGTPEPAEPPYILVRAETAITGTSFARFFSSHDDNGRPAVSFELFPSEAGRFADITRRLAEKGSLAIFLNGKLESAPRVKSAITNGYGIITLGEQRSIAEAQKEQQQLLISLSSGALSAPIQKKALNYISPTLGPESVKRGVTAMVIGALLVLGFMLVYYRMAGMVANFAIVLNVIILLGIMCAFEATFSLFGIAGVVLTIGMSVDANILIYERIREEKAAGKALQGAVASGYQRAFSAIFDSNITTIGTALILLMVGTGTIKAFAITLAVGIAASMFTAIFVTRVVFTLLMKGQIFREAKMMQLFKRPNLNFVKAWRYAIVGSLILIVTGVSLFISKGSKNFGIDFLGGGQYRVNVDQDISVAQVRDKLAGLTPGAALPEVLQMTPSGGAGQAKIFQFQVRVSQEMLRQWVANEELLGSLPEDQWVDFAKKKIVEALGVYFPPDGIKEDFEHGDFRMMLLRLTYNSRAGEETALSQENLKVRIDQAMEDLKNRLTGEPVITAYSVRASGTAVEPLYFEISATFAARYIQTSAEEKAAIIEKQLANVVSAKFGPKFEINTDYKTDPDSVARLVLSLQAPSNLAASSYAGLVEEIIGKIKTELPESVSDRKYVVEASAEHFTAVNTEGGAIFLQIPVAVYNSGDAANRDTYATIVRNVREYLRGEKFAGREVALPAAPEQKYPILLSPGGIESADEFKPKVARELRGDAFKAIMLSFVFIVFYLWFRFRKLSFGLGAVIALVHDVLISVGAIALFDLMPWFDIKFDLPIVAALLTIVGYSVNDTIVIFDRIRENLALHRDARYFEENINNSINQTLGRTIWTSATTFFVVFALAVFGGETLRGFAVILCVGIAVGTYSSIFIASPIVAWFHRRELKKMAPAYTAPQRMPETAE